VRQASESTGDALGLPLALVNVSFADLAALDAAEEVEIETVAADGAIHRTIIWVVVDGQRVYVRSVRGEVARWYREAIARAEVALHLAGRRIAMRVEPAADEASVAACSAGLRRKYRADHSLRAMLMPDVLGTTLVLEVA